MDRALRAKYDAIAYQMGDDRFFTKKELRYLPETLAPGEDVLGFASGHMDGNTWLIALTNRRVLFLDKGMLYGLRQVSIPIERINSVSGSTGLVFGSITVTDGARSYKIANVPKKTVQPFTDKLRDLISAKLVSTPTTTAPANPHDERLAALERLASLLAGGALTQEEFDREKAKVLAT